MRFVSCFPILALLASPVLAASAAAPNTDWRDYLGGPDRTHYSPLQQITPENVSQLKVAWQYHTGDVGEMQCNPLVVDGVLYATTAANNIVALDAATGRERWRYRPPGEKALRNVRGVAYWCDGDDCRILFSVDEWLCAINAKTGQLIDRHRRLLADQPQGPALAPRELTDLQGLGAA